ncbi:MAG: DHH family phosphoesterase [candidate division WOR-3 bacterium]|nr:DHH family phosphoesterase [candidate division WOR-3 bacterium]
MWQIKPQPLLDWQQLLPELPNKINLRLVQLLVLRNIKSAQEMIKFLNPELSYLHPNTLLPDIEPALHRIQKAIAQKEPILLWGHEDLDGISAIVVLYQTLKAIKGQPLYYIPQKGKERHGLNPDKVQEFQNTGVKLVITVDCGITNNQEIEIIQKSGVDVIVTDHHEVLDKLPNAISNVNPKRLDSQYPFSLLAGVGVALKVALALVEKHLTVSPKEFFSLFTDLLPITALGTIADRVPLIDENRIFTQLGLKALPNVKNNAVNAVFDVVGLSKQNLTVEKFFAEIIPLFGSANGNQACDYFLNQDYDACYQWAQELYKLSQEWREAAKQNCLIAEQVKDMGDGIILVYDERLNLKALGHCAGRLKDAYQLPVVVMGKRNDDWVGECRGINGVDLIAMLKAHSAYFTDFGGHKKACGFTLPKAKLKPFINAVKKYAKEKFVGNIIKENQLIADMILPLDEITDEFKQLAPFGEANPAPVLISPKTNLTKEDGKIIYPPRPELKIECAPNLPVNFSGNTYDILYTFNDNLEITVLDLATAYNGR